MSERSFRNYFGPSPRHPRACVEIVFPLAAGECRIDHFDPALTSFGVMLAETLPDRALRQDEAVCLLAASLLSRHGSWWRDHGSGDGFAWAAIAHPMPSLAREALGLALDLVLGLGDIPVTREKVQTLARALKTLSEPKLWMLEMARLHDRGTAELSREAEIYQIGEGARGLHFHRLGNQRDSFTGPILERSKYITAQTLHQLDLPATHGVLVESPEQAVAAIAQIGLPCVVKPTSMSRGVGVATGLGSAEQVAAAAQHALEISRRPVLVENHVEGHDHRMLVSEGELLWVYRRLPASVVGDGQATIGELVERENRRRAVIRGGAEGYLVSIPAGEALARFMAASHAFGVDHVLPPGERIDVAAQANIAQGGLLEDVTEVVHPDNRALAIKVSRLFRIGTIGIDFVTPDIARSWKDTPCAIVEVNRMPGVGGLGDVSLVQRTLFPQHLSGKIPVIAVVGDEHYREAMHAALEQAFTENGTRLATAPYDEAVPTIRPIGAALLDPDAEAITVLCSPTRVEQSGLPLVRCDLLIVQDEARFRWLGPFVQEVLGGAPSNAKLDHAIGKLTRRHADPAGGGPLPVLEVVDGGPDEFRLKVWRARAMPRGWFWNQVGMAAPDDTGMTTHDDLLAAVRALACQGDDTLEIFAYPELTCCWLRVTFEAALALPSTGREDGRAALLAATERVNAIVAAKS